MLYFQRALVKDARHAHFEAGPTYERPHNLNERFLVAQRYGQHPSRRLVFRRATGHADCESPPLLAWPTNRYVSGREFRAIRIKVESGLTGGHSSGL